MPLLPSGYEAPCLLRSGHLNTLFAHLFRRVRGVRYARERIDTADGDFLDLDWSKVRAGRVAILSHGLEGSAQAGYVRGMVRALNRHGWDALAWNLRGCSGAPNRLPRSYHSGATDDLATVIHHALSGAHGYRRAALVGFSLGGNLTLKYLGERGADVNPRIRRAVAFSVPCDLASSADALSAWANWHYTWHFLRALRRKMRAKRQAFPEEIRAEGGPLRTLRAFDDRYTAPLHGFADAADYYRQSSSRPLLPAIRVPTLLVNAADDPFLAGPSYPVEEARRSTRFFLEVPQTGGHVGFVTFGSGGTYWSERRAAVFLGETAHIGRNL